MGRPGKKKKAAGATPPPIQAQLFLPVATLEEIAAMDPEKRGQFFARLAVWPEKLEDWRTEMGGKCGHKGCEKGILFRHANNITFEIYGYRYMQRGALYANQRISQGEMTGLNHCYVLVWNSTPEKDGTRKPYALRVSGAQATGVCGAVAETFGRAAHGWFPIQET